MSIEEKVVEILKSNTKVGELDASNLSKVTFNQLGLNSLNFVKVIVELEDAFEIEFEDSQINYELLNNIEELVKLIKSIVV